MLHSYDIETEEWDRFVVGACLSDDGTFVCEEWQREREFAEYLLSLEGELIAHNGGRFDTIWLCGWIRRLKMRARVFATSARITSVKVGKLDIRDSSALVPMSLAQAAKLGGVGKLETGLECVCGEKYGEKCGGYCRIRRDMSREDMETLKVYLRADCEAPIRYMQALRAYADEHGLKLASTIGASAWRTAKETYDLEDAQWSPPRLYSFAREGYYGGRVQVFRPFSQRGSRWDMNSAYVGALSRTALPVGSRREVSGTEARDAFRRGLGGVYRARVRIERQHIPPLPVRAKGDKGGRVYYPYGEVTGTWTGLELSYALQHGVTILEHGAALVWSDMDAVLAPWAKSVWALRDAAIKSDPANGKKNPFATWLKWFGNSLTGKLAQKPETDLCEILPEPPPPCPRDAFCGGVLCGMVGCCPHRCTGACGTMKPIGKPTSGVWSRETWRIASNAHVQWAAYLTAAARTRLHTQLVSDGQGGKSAVYCDTDSCYAEKSEAVDAGDGLMQWLYEGEYSEFRALAPKTYSFIDGKGKREVKAKGVPKPDWLGILDGEPQRVRTGVVQFRSAMRDPERAFRRRDMSRVVTCDRFGDRLFPPDSDTTIPIDWGERTN